MLDEAIIKIMENALEVGHTEVIKDLKEYADYETQDEITEWLIYNKKLCPDCIAKLYICETTWQHGWSGDIPIEEPIILIECPRCGWMDD